MPECELRHATFEDIDDVYALMCELKQAEYDRDAFYTGFAANLEDRNLHYQFWPYKTAMWWA
ncbi:aminoalkylphosphonic acid N-acetyltransferase [Kluyvera cryocrescens]|uniref:Aminoalkylphosphonic acid N-acetyltransferase n=1 Tax=Kluyvera cryocrescens TaxID=580 RepID=A0A485A659_KLUCR|nr:aminoalkylphosphonic acid N-acetyltransferase [Kluyvera cryocrescens]